MKPSMLGLLIAAGAFGASTIYLAVQLENERTRADEVLEQSHALNARLLELEKARAEWESLQLMSGGALVGEALPQDGKRQTALPEEAPAQASPRTEAPERFGSRRTPERSEAMQKMLRIQVRSNYKRLNGDIGEKLGLGKEDTNKLIDLIVDQQLAAMERGRQDRGSLTREQREAARTEEQARNLADIGALIGADKLETYKAYQEALPARQEVDLLSRQLDASDLGLSKDQRDRMVSALADERKRVPAPSFSSSGSREEYSKAMSVWQEDYNQRAASRAASILNGEQQSAYADYQQWTQEMRQQFDARRAARGRGPDGPPPGQP